MAKRVFFTDVYTEDGLKIERKLDNKHHWGILLENPNVGYIVYGETVQLDSGHVQPGEKTNNYYTRDDYNHDLNTGRIKLDSKK